MTCTILRFPQFSVVALSMVLEISGRRGAAPRLAAASPLKCNMLFVTELWTKSLAMEPIWPSKRRGGKGRIYKKGRDSTYSVRPFYVCLDSGLTRRMTTMQCSGEI